MVHVAIDAIGGDHAPAAIVGHGRSSPKAVRNGIAMAYRFATGDFILLVAQEIAAATVSHH